MSILSDASDFSPGGNSLSSLSLDLGDLSIDTTSPKASSPVPIVDKDKSRLPSNISDNGLNISIAYSVSLDDLEVEPTPHDVSSKRKLKKAPRFSSDSHRKSGYSPLATNILNIQNSSLKHKRFSEFFRAELSNLNLGSDNPPVSTSDKNEGRNTVPIDTGEDFSLGNISIESVKENMSNLSINDESIGLNKLSSSRYSEFFRSEASQLNLSSPDISFDLPESPKNSDLSLVLTDGSRENSRENSLSKPPEKPFFPGTSCNKPRSFSEHFRNEVSQLNLSSPEISFDIDSPKNNDLSLELSEISRENSISAQDQKQGVERYKKESDDDHFYLVTPAQSRGKKNILDSSDEDLSASDCENENPALILKRSEKICSSEDEKYDSSFIDDEAIEEEETNSEDESEDEYLPSPGYSDSGNKGSRSKHVQASQSSSDDDYLTPPNVVKETPFLTPGKDVKKSNPTNLYKTPSTFCHSPATPASKNIRRRTCLATPLSVKTKTGTPGLPNRTYSRNLLAAARELFLQFNQFVFGNQLPSDLEIKLNKRLNTTAGRCVYMRKGDQYKAHIELSPKVVDCLERLKETLAHELCHAATFIIDKKMDNHGPIWRRWAKRVNVKYPELPPVSRCHSYQIQYKYNYKCSEEWCDYTIGRHSKSIDLERARCPMCYSRLTLPVSSQTPGKTPNKWTEFVKSRYGQVKEDQPPRTPHKDLMKILSEQFKEMKTSGQGP